MAQKHTVQEAGDRIGHLLNELTAIPDASIRARVEELIALLVELYGAGLERIADCIASEPGGDALMRRLAEDDLVASLLVLHGLHPLDTATRVQQALDRVRPYLGSHAGGVALLGIDDHGVVHLRLEGSCHGCPSSTLTVKLAIERAIEEAAPEITGVEVEGLAEQAHRSFIPLDSLRGNGREQGSMTSTSAPGWITIDDFPSLPSGAFWTTVIAGEAILLCRSGSELYAYRNGCAACGAAWEPGWLDSNVLRCPLCGARYDIRLAGRSVDRQALHLDPLPLLKDGTSVRVAVPGGVV